MLCYLYHIRRPKGTAFLKFKTVDAVDAAFSAANAAAGLGIFVKGRQLKVLRALDKKSAQNKELEKTKKEEHDHRNLYLAKVSYVTPLSSLSLSVVRLLFSAILLGYRRSFKRAI